jgi:hypothetical protein
VAKLAAASKHRHHPSAATLRSCTLLGLLYPYLTGDSKLARKKFGRNLKPWQPFSPAMSLRQAP